MADTGQDFAENKTIREDRERLVLTHYPILKSRDTYLRIAMPHDWHSVTVPRMGSLSPHPHRREKLVIVSQVASYVRSLVSKNAVLFRVGRVKCVNVSAKGMLIVLSRRLKPGDLVEVRWTADGQASAAILEVRWCKALRRGNSSTSYHAGCRRIFSTDTAARSVKPPRWT